VELLLATRNRGKLAELSALLAGTGWQAVTLDEYPQAGMVEEDGQTFAENAVKKARAAFAVARIWTLAEDAGLEVDALGGEPGVMSARYAGPDATDRDRIRKLLDGIVAVPEAKRTARFRCVMCLVDPAGHERLFEGACEGSISHHARGTLGFGYDPVFIPAGRAQTFGELGLDVKSELSHRARAMRRVVEYLSPLAGH
jgi:XTP/dITP diphosphohydrolase